MSEGSDGISIGED